MNKVTFNTTSFEQACGLQKEITVVDELAKLIVSLEDNENAKNFDEARKTINKIKNIFDEPFHAKFVPKEKDCRTLKAVHMMLKSHPIRLDYKFMDITGYFKLLQNVKDRLFNKKVNITTQRKIVAEEMSKLNLYPQVLTEKWELRECKPPNRAFMDILYKIRPEFAKDDLLRREYTKLDNAWEKKDKKLVKELEQNIKNIEGNK